MIIPSFLVFGESDVDLFSPFIFLLPLNQFVAILFFGVFEELLLLLFQLLQMFLVLKSRLVLILHLALNIEITFTSSLTSSSISLSSFI